MLVEGEDGNMPTSQGKVEFAKIEPEALPNRRTTYKNIDELAADIRRVGLLQPPLIWRKKLDKETHYVLLAGHRRYKAISLIREEDKTAFDTIGVTLFDGNEDDALKAQLAENVQREELNPLELSDACTDLVNRGHSTKDIAACINRSIAWIGKLLKIRQTCAHKVLQALAEGKISVSVAFDLMEHPEEKQLKLLADCVQAKQTKGTKEAKKISRNESSKATPRGKKAMKLLYETVAAFDDDDYWRGVSEGLAFSLGMKTALEQEVALELEERKTEDDGIEEDETPKKKRGKVDLDEVAADSDVTDETDEAEAD